MYYLDMCFPDGVVPDFGSIRMTDVSRTYFDYTDDHGNKTRKRLRKYILKSEDKSKLSLITNAADGSKALLVDTSEIYILCDGQWSKISRSGGSGGGSDEDTPGDWGDIDEPEDWGDIGEAG